MNILPWKIFALFSFIICLAGFSMAQSDYALHSPDGRIDVKVHAADRLTYDVSFKGTPLLQNGQFSINIDHVVLGMNPKVVSAKERNEDRILEPVVRQKFAKIRDNYRELHLELEDGLAVTFRAYNEGAAYRLETSLPQAQVHVYGEEAIFRFASDHTVFYPTEESFFSHNERRYLPQTMSQIAPAMLASLPAVVDAGDGVKVAIAESDVDDYPGLWLHGTSANALAATFPPYPLKDNWNETVISKWLRALTILPSPEEQEHSPGV
jgi:alpha-glucosidase